MPASEVTLVDPEGVRFVPGRPSGVGVLVLAGSSGRIDADRARIIAATGALTESIRWFGGPGQHDGPWEIALELFLARVDALRVDCDRVVVLGTSFGSEAALLVGATSAAVDAVLAFAPSDVVWAGLTTEGGMTSHWTSRGVPLPYVPFASDWKPEDDPPSHVGLYEHSREMFARDVEAAAIPVERIAELVLVAGGDDRVWPSLRQAELIRDRRAAHGLATALVCDAEAGHRTILPGEALVRGGMRMRRGGSERADRRLGELAWREVLRVCAKR